MHSPLPLLALLVGSTALTVHPIPAPISVPTVSTKVELHPQSSAVEGLLTAKGQDADQTLGWEPPSGSLEAAAEHERNLVYMALHGVAPSDAPTPLGITVAGVRGLQWEVSVASTFFVGTSFDCPAHRVALATFGPNQEQVTQIHALSLAGASCGATGEAK